MLISVETARNSEIGEVFKSHETLFVTNIDRDYFTLVVFVLYEKCKGEQSFWFPYFEGVNPGVYACLWSEDVIN